MSTFAFVPPSAEEIRQARACFVPPTPEEIRRIRDEMQVGLIQARRIAWKAAMREAIARASSVDDMRGILFEFLKDSAP